MAAGVKLVDGHRFAVEAAGQTGTLLVAQCDSALVLSDIKLAVETGPVVTVLQRLGLPDEQVASVPWAELDRAFEPDHLTCLWIPALAEPVAAEITRFAELTRTLRARCPWDRAQTHQSLTRHLIEEAYEVVEAIDELDQPGPSGPLSGEQPDGYGHLEEELGDLLFQVVLHATLAAEAGAFTLTDVTVGIHDKLVARHPHVFGDADPDDAVANWEHAKMAEKGRTSALDGVTAGLPALLHAAKVQRRAASVGFDWENVAGAWPKVVEELRELEVALGASPGGGPAVSEELGDLLFAVVNVARHLDIDAETALRHATAKFADRFRHIEARAEGARLSLDEWDV
ncbi:MAG: nucleoside triphosphate pyrophosphohydrolase, partial [Actinomycetes bacterium]